MGTVVVIFLFPIFCWAWPIVHWQDNKENVAQVCSGGWQSATHCTVWRSLSASLFSSGEHCFALSKPIKTSLVFVTSWSKPSQLGGVRRGGAEEEQKLRGRRRRDPVIAKLILDDMKLSGYFGSWNILTSESKVQGNFFVSLWQPFLTTASQRCKKRHIWQIYLCYSFQGSANFWICAKHYRIQEFYNLSTHIYMYISSHTYDIKLPTESSNKFFTKLRLTQQLIWCKVFNPC